MATAAPAQLNSGLPNLNDPAVRAKFTQEAVGGGGTYLPGGPSTVDPKTAMTAYPGAQPQTPQGQYGLDPSLSAYLDQFNTSLAGSRKAIDTQLAQAMGELGGRRDAAAKVVAGLPAEIAQAYAPAAAGLTQAGAAGQGALSQDVRGAVGALAGPLQSALAMEKGGGTAMRPYLDLANQANYGAGAGALRQQAMIGQQDLDAQQRTFVQGLLQNQLQRSQSNDDFYAHAMFADQLQRGDKAYDANIAQQQARDQLAQSYGLKDDSSLNDVVNSPAYKYAVQSMATGLYNNDGPSSHFGQSFDPLSDTEAIGNSAGNRERQTGATIAKKYASNPDLLKALLANHYLTPGDLAAAGIQLPAPSK